MNYDEVEHIGMSMLNLPVGTGSRTCFARALRIMPSFHSSLFLPVGQLYVQRGCSPASGVGHNPVYKPLRVTSLLESLWQSQNCF